MISDMFDNSAHCCKSDTSDHCDHYVNYLTLSQDDQILYSASDDKIIRAWNVADVADSSYMNNMLKAYYHHI